jgi:hypothetical protein
MCSKRNIVMVAMACSLVICRGAVGVGGGRRPQYQLPVGGSMIAVPVQFDNGCSGLVAQETNAYGELPYGGPKVPQVEIYDASGSFWGAYQPADGLGKVVNLLCDPNGEVMIVDVWEPSQFGGDYSGSGDGLPLDYSGTNINVIHMLANAQSATEGGNDIGWWVEYVPVVPVVAAVPDPSVEDWVTCFGQGAIAGMMMWIPLGVIRVVKRGLRPERVGGGDE